MRRQEQVDAERPRQQEDEVAGIEDAGLDPRQRRHAGADERVPERQLTGEQAGAQRELLRVVVDDEIAQEERVAEDDGEAQRRDGGDQRDERGVPAQPAQGYSIAESTGSSGPLAMPSLSSRYRKLRKVMPSRRAASLRMPPVCLSARVTRSRS